MQLLHLTDSDVWLPVSANVNWGVVVTPPMIIQPQIEITPSSSFNLHSETFSDKSQVLWFLQASFFFFFGSIFRAGIPEWLKVAAMYISFSLECCLLLYSPWALIKDRWCFPLWLIVVLVVMARVLTATPLVISLEVCLGQLLSFHFFFDGNLWGLRGLMRNREQSAQLNNLIQVKMRNSRLCF